MNDRDLVLIPTNAITYPLVDHDFIAEVCPRDIGVADMFGRGLVV